MRASAHDELRNNRSRRWDRLHYARVAIIVAASVLTLVAATVR
jgi:hypothetical protein